MTPPCRLAPHRLSTLLTIAFASAVAFDVGCSQNRAAVSPDASVVGPTTSDMSVMGPCDDTHPCPNTNRCYLGTCIPDNGTCGSDDDCENDSYCDCSLGPTPDAGHCAGLCIPWGLAPRGDNDPMCHGSGFPVSDFQAPVDVCHWTLPQQQESPIIMTPLVVDLDLDGKPEIVFSNFTFQNNAALIAIHASDCSTYFMHPSWKIMDCSELAAADLDGDKYPEIIGIIAENRDDPRIAVWNHLGALLAESPDPYMMKYQGGDCSGPAVADVDGDGTPEILVSGQVVRYHKGNNQLEVLWNNPPSTGIPAHWGTLSLFADMDGDGRPEAVTGLKVYDGLTGADKTPSVMTRLGDTGAYPQIADFNGDKKPDILLVQSQPMLQQVSIVDFANNKIIFGPYTVASTPDRPGGWGGPATIADLDGDGVPDFGLSSYRRYYAYALKCAQNPKPADCTGTDDGVLWDRAIQDLSSGGTASAVFDFNGDGRAEVVYRDECWLRVMNGPDGKTVFARPITSGTALEYPVVADIDGDGHADLVVPSDSVPCDGVDEGQTGQQHTGPTQGIFVMRDPMNRWMSSRPLWNEHTYHITNIQDNMTVPLSETSNWLGYNNYRQNAQGSPGNAAPEADFTGRNTGPIDNGGMDCKVSQRLWASICNRGAATAPAGIHGSFYPVDPRKVAAPPVCTTQTTMPLYPGKCEDVYCDWANPPGMSVDLWFRSDDDGSGKVPEASECKEGNDVLYMPGVNCYVPG